MKKKFILLIALAGCLSNLSAQQPAVLVSNAPGWHKIAETTVDFTKDRDEVMVLGADRFTALKFMVTEAPIDLQDLEVWSEKGTKQNIQVRTLLEMGKESRVIELYGGSQEVNKIVFIYKTLPNRTDTKAHVEIYGLKADKAMAAANNDEERAKMDRDRMERDHEKIERDQKEREHMEHERKESEARNHDKMDHPANHTHNDTKSTKEGAGIPKPELIISDKTGWHKIGETTVSFKKETDEIAVIGSDRFAKLKFKVHNAGIIINDLDIWYEDGTKQDISVHSTYVEGHQSPLIDIPGNEKDIKRISFTYHTIPNQNKDRAHVEIFGLKSNVDKKMDNRK